MCLHILLQYFYFLQTLIYSDQYEEDEYLAMNIIADKANQKSLGLSVVEPYVWYRLAINRFIIDAKDPEIVNLLKLSFYTGRVEPNLFLLRLGFLSRYIDSIDNELMRLLEDQVRLAWALKKHQLVTAVISTPVLKPLVYNALSPDDILDFNLRLDKAIKKNNKSK